MQIKNYFFAAAIVALTACGGSQTVAPTAADTFKTGPSDHLVMSTLWFQKSQEARQIFRQTYQLAEQRMMENKGKMSGDRPPAIIIDIDETVLDNSPYEARLAVNGKSFNEESWAAWVNEANAKTLPGARDFLRKAEAMGVEVFYISNRSIEQVEATIENLQRQDLPFADHEHVLLKADNSSKEERRERVKARAEVILSVGDQLSDFSDWFAEQYGAEEVYDSDLLDSLNQYFILLPNPMYGAFESTLYPHGSDLTEAEKAELRKKALDIRRMK